MTKQRLPRGARRRLEGAHLIYLRRAGNGWIAASYTREGKNTDLGAGSWKQVRAMVLNSLQPRLAEGGGS